ncbi:MAG: hypothetical protein JSU58_02860 [Dehalococcoidales bacterium]|nr:MAG: hypothetical protein JSU58_02860 [Dehalococcoidales bacterium]
MATSHFANYMERDSKIHGVPLRFSFPPHPTAWVSRETHQKYVEGNDPMTGQPLMEELIDALTRPLTEAEKHPEPLQRPRRPRLLEPDTEDNLRRLFIRNGWTDGLPIILPTEERVAEMLTGTDHDPQEVMGHMSVTPHEEKLEYTVEKVAINAVMAGARPEHFPVILAIAATQRALIPSSTGSWCHMVLVNGPIRNEIGMNCGSSALSPFNFANSVIGRCGTLMTINFGDINLAENFTGGAGNNFNYNNLCCGENQERSPFEPFHVQKGFKETESAISLFRGWSMQGFSVGPARRMAEVMCGMGGSTFILDPIVARSLKEEEGFETKQQLAEYLAKEAKTISPGGMRPFDPSQINFIVLGGEWNPIFMTADFTYIQTDPIGGWIPASGIRKDDIPIRMPVQLNCMDGTCEIPQ